MTQSLLEQLWTFITNKGDFVAAIIAGITLIYQMKQSNEQRKNAIILENEKNFLTLAKEFREAWGRIVQKTGNDHNAVLDVNYLECKNEDLRLDVHEVIDILKIFYLVNKNKPEWQQESTQRNFWMNKVRHVFSHKLFLTAFKKYYTTDPTGFPISYVNDVNYCVRKYNKNGAKQNEKNRKKSCYLRQKILL